MKGHWSTREAPRSAARNRPRSVSHLRPPPSRLGTLKGVRIIAKQPPSPIAADGGCGAGPFFFLSPCSLVLLARGTAAMGTPVA